MEGGEEEGAGLKLLPFRTAVGIKKKRENQYNKPKIGLGLKNRTYNIYSYID